MNSTDTKRAVVGVVGLGLVGQALSARLLAAGFAVTGFDVRADAGAALAAAGAEIAGSSEAVGRRADCVVLAVFDTTDVVAVLEGANGLLAAGHRVRTVIDCSTGEPDRLAALAERLARRGIAFVEGPLSGSSRQIAGGEATQLLGGDADAIARIAAVLDALSPRRIHVGPVGAAARAKLATNLVLGLNRAALAEGMVFAQAVGIDAETFLQLVLATPARSAAAEAKGDMMVRGEFTPQSRIRQHLKDVDLMLAAARSAGQDLPLSEVHARLMRDAVAAGDGELDNAAIIRQFRRELFPSN